MNAHRLLQKKIMLFFLLFFLVCGMASDSFAFTLPFKKINNFWICITNPMTTFYLGTDFPRIVVNEYDGGKILSVPVSGLSMPSFLESMKMENNSPALPGHQNFLIKILTFYNSKSLDNLNMATNMGEYYLPYILFAYDTVGQDWFYLAKYLDAPSVLLYGYAWFVNIPQKIIKNTDNIFKYRHKLEGVSYFQIIDDITNILSLFVEIPLAIIGTIFGTIFALIWHPIDSITSFLGIFYFIASTTFNAIWGIISNFILFIIHFMGYNCRYFL